MALAIPSRSIFSGTITGEEIGNVRAIGTTAQLRAAEQIERGANFQVSIATPEAIREASVNTGIETEVIQDRIADLAHADYPAYLTYKRNVLGTIRAEVMRTYINTVKMYEDLGYPKIQAEKLAGELAKDVKASQMKIYNTLFPNSGQKVQNVY